MSKSAAWTIGGAALIGMFFAVSYYIMPAVTRDTYTAVIKNDAQAAAGTTTDKAEKEYVAHVRTPEAVKAIYMTACAAATPSFRSRLTQLVEDTELNAIVIDVKDFSGSLLFYPKNPDLMKYAVSDCVVKDMKELIADLHDRNIYTIARVTVFQDPLFSKFHPEEAIKRASDGAIWKDKKGISFIDPSSQKAWAHIDAIAHEAYDIGFDEINFDYIRFPSDGNMKDIAFPHSKDMHKSEVMERYYKHIYDTYSGTGIVTSADIFGMTTTSYDNLNIGQVLEKTLPYFDYVAPMVYPSHYPPQFLGWENPNAKPYDLIKIVMSIAAFRAEATSTIIQTIGSEPIASTTPQKYTKPSFSRNKLRPWLQDFDLGQPAYGEKEVRDQIRATYDAGLTSWMLWDAANRYTPSALEK